ncbi:MAG TPA: ABC transporter ATP-binding protein [Candidatus Bipolaricaulota bacterium]
MAPSQRSSEAVIALERVTKRFGKFLAVDDVNLSIRQGEFFSLLGSSGCGKTTTLRMIAGFESPSEGRVMLEGQDVSNVPAYRRNVNMVFQHYALFPHMNVFDNIAFGLRNKRLPVAQIRERVLGMLDVVHMEGYEKRKPNELSGGQQQRVALARALVNFPSALLLDEPLGALDLKLRRAMQLELKKIQREVGITFIYVTHDQEEALTMSDRIAVMNEGHVEQLASPEEIYDHPSSRFVAEFIGMANLISATVAQTNGTAATLQLPAGGRTLANTDGRTFRSGEDVLLILRPERLNLCTQEPNGNLGCLKASVVDCVFQGSVVRFALRSPAGQDLVVMLPPQQRPAGAEAGSQVWITWEPQYGYLLNNDPSRAQEIAPQP